jgi:dolichol-phosphate mannosyltransferase
VVIARFHDRLRTVLTSLPDLDYRMVYVDDGSSDRTLEELNSIAAGDARVHVYSLSRNFGHQTALSAGLDVARGDGILMMDSDLQHPPELIPEMVARWQQGFDVVSAVRQGNDGDSLAKRLSSRAFYSFINQLSDVPIVPGAADFCLLSRHAHQALCAMPERHRFLRGMVSWIGFRRTFVPFHAPARAAGHSKYTPRKQFRLALDAVFSFTAVPMKLAFRSGLVVAGLGLAFLVYILARFLFLGDLVPGWASLICTLLLLGGVQTVFIGLLGEYLARVFEETKGRPRYFFKQASESSSATADWPRRQSA